MPLPPSSRFGTYEILSALGAGGMGEVYRARDPRLNRDVAIKILLPAVANDPDRLARFSREAQVLASLNHPNIAAIYGVEGVDDAKALVLELVDGPTLADLIAKGPLPLDDALSIARQIADALEAAHERDVIHRDLKPANVKVRRDGTVKVLDFGLAKTLDDGTMASSSPPQTAQITTPAMTEAGMILGTAAYMSPEQSRGGVVDRRSDVWAFGCVLYEMLTGRRAFDRRGSVRHVGGGAQGRPHMERVAAGDARSDSSAAAPLPGERSQGSSARHRQRTARHRRSAGSACQRRSACDGGAAAAFGLALGSGNRRAHRGARRRSHVAGDARASARPNPADHRASPIRV